jgi:hypothetical protein
LSPLNISDQNENLKARQSLIKFSDTKFHENPSSGTLVAPCTIELSRIQNGPEKGKENVTVNTDKI